MVRPEPLGEAHMTRVGAYALVALVTLVGSLTACGDEGPEGGPGNLSATLASPNGVEGAALLEIFGPGIQSVSAVKGRLFQHAFGDTVRLAIILDTPGTIRFAVSVADTTRKPTAVVLEVAGGTNALRSGLAGYRVEGLR
jgi:hypothetical protein